MRLGRVVVLAGNVARRDGPFFDREQRFAGFAVEKEQETGFGRLGDGLDRLSAALDFHQRRLRGQIPVPQIVMDRLEVPAAAARAAVQREQAVAEQVFAGAVSAVIVVSGRGQRNVGQPQVFVHAGHRPHIRAAAVFPGIAPPGIVAELAGARHGMEAPAQLARARVVSPDVAAGALGQAVADPAADHQGALTDGNRGGEAVTAVRFAENVGGGIEHAVFAEARVGLAGLAVDGKNASVLVAQHEALGRPLPPVFDAAAGEEVIAAVAVELRVERPEQFAVAGVDRQQAVHRRRNVKRAVDHQRRSLEGRTGGVAALAVRKVARVVFPGELEPGDVAAVDLVERGVAAAALVVAVVRPLLGLQRAEEDEPDEKKTHLRKQF